jgi:hypothetical protein
MSLFTKTGADAAASAVAEKSDKSFSKFSPGTTYRVRIASIADLVEYFAHGDKNSGIKTSACAKHLGQPDLYDAAVDVLYKEANALEESGDDAGAKAKKDEAYRLKAKPRYIRGFYNLADGKPLVIDLTKNQSKLVTQALEKNAKKIANRAFELEKKGSGTDTTVTLTILDDDDLTPAEQKNFAALDGKEFDHDLFEVISLRDQEGQIADLIAFGFDVSKIGVNISVSTSSNDASNEKSDAEAATAQF